MKDFHKLTSKQQNDIRREYKDTYTKDYNHSIHLYILYVIVGILTLGSLILMIIKSIPLGIILFIIGIIIQIIIINLLNKSNIPFYKFLKTKGYKVEQKK